MQAAGVPVPPGTDAAADIAQARVRADELGYPILVKPSGGGGGRGMRVVKKGDELEAALVAARREAAQSFGDSEVYLEKVITGARHVEVQIMADGRGNVVHVGDRDCSMQRRHQKVVEEAPAPTLSAAQHERVRELAVRAARAANYVNAGTVEFLFDGEDAFYVLEVNTRIQVEHCVSEMVSGIDLVAEQIRVAAGEKLSFAQKDVVLRGHAIECRVYAEQPEKGFLPAPGRVTAAEFPGGPWVREDRSFEPGDQVTPFYDGMIAKVIAWGPDRRSAAARMARALAEYRIEGIATNVAFLRWLVACEPFLNNRFDIGFIEREFRPELLPAEAPARATAPAAARAPAAAPARSAPGPSANGAVPVSLFHYVTSGDTAHAYLIHVVTREQGRFEAIPVSPSQRWAEAGNRRTGSSAAAAVDALVREVLDKRWPSEIFPELAVTY
jgi:acetyl/propionyl-CoA carboxylase alpha subunit